MKGYSYCLIDLTDKLSRKFEYGYSECIVDAIVDHLVRFSHHKIELISVEKQEFRTNYRIDESDVLCYDAIKLQRK